MTVDLPTPPLPDAIAYTRVMFPGWVKGMTGSGLPPRSCVSKAVALLLRHDAQLDLTPVTPSTVPTPRPRRRA